MNSAITLFFASLVSGMLSLTDLRPTFSEVVQILTGVALEAAESTASSTQAYHSQKETASCPTQQAQPAIPACASPAVAARS